MSRIVIFADEMAVIYTLEHPEIAYEDAFEMILNGTLPDQNEILLRAVINLYNDSVVSMHKNDPPNNLCKKCSHEPICAFKKTAQLYMNLLGFKDAIFKAELSCEHFSPKTTIYTPFPR